jgi:hypothetical protein
MEQVFPALQKSVRRRARFNVAKRLRTLDTVESSVEDQQQIITVENVEKMPGSSTASNAAANIAESTADKDIDMNSELPSDYESACNFESYSNSESDTDSAAEYLDLGDALRNWAVRFNITLVALSALLLILRVCHSSLPKDARTLLKTRRNVTTEQKAGGQFFHFGLLESLQLLLHKLGDKMPDGYTFFMQLNIDGLPLFKSSSIQFWPILGLLKGFYLKPVVISLFCGSCKPKSLDDFLGSIVNEIKILKNGFDYQGKRFFLIICAVICDAPARAFVKAVKSHNGYGGCDKCSQSGSHISGRMTFPETNANLRTDSMFNS